MSDIHYFQRYHSKENVHTANAFLLINRLYQYKPQYFYQFLDMLTEDEPLEYQFRLNMTLQERSDSKKGSTIPDAMIVQHGYRLCVEIKIGDCFHADQIKGHLEAFNKLDTKYKLLLSLSNVDECGIAPEIKGLVDEFNKVNNLYNEERLIYRHLTFEKLIEMMECILSERDYEFVDILNDYKEYCTEQGLIDDRYQLMKAYAVGATIEINKKLNLYYRTATDNVKADILGMYKDKEIRPPFVGDWENTDRLDQAGRIFDWDDSAGISEYVDCLWETFRSGNEAVFEADIEKYSRRMTTRKMVEIFDSLIHENPAFRGQNR